MSTVIFPEMNLNLKISQIAFTLFGVQIYWYAIIMALAFIIALLICKIKEKLYNIKFNNVIDLVIYLIPISIISARAYYLIFNLEYYLTTPLQMINLRTGGLAIYGGMIGGTITCYIFCKKRKIQILNLLDYIVPSLAIGQSIGRWGNFINVEAYGTQTMLPWRMGIYNGTEYQEVHPTFFYESIATFIIFVILTKLQKKRKYKGQITYAYLILYSLVRMSVEGLRIDSLMLGNLRISQILSVIIFIIFLGIYVKNICQNNKKNATMKNKT